MAHPSRRTVLRTTAAAASLAAAPGSTLLWSRPAVADTPGPEQVHLGFGNEPSREMTVSWATAASVSRPRLRLGTAKGGFGRVLDAETRTYVDGLNKVETYTHRVRLHGLQPDTPYVYEVSHDGATPGAAPSAPPPSRAAPRSASPASATWAPAPPPSASPPSTARRPCGTSSSSRRCSTCSTATWRTPTTIRPCSRRRGTRS